jgi:pimeloyl-ACP methyl ester carboxylesterase
VLAVGADLACWERLPPRLSENVELRTLSLPRSERSPRRAAEALLAPIESSPRPRVLLGHDRGGSVAIELAQFAARALDGLILHAPRGARWGRLGRWLSTGPVLSAEWEGSLRPVILPAALLWGERDRVLPVGQVERFRPLLPGALVSLPGRWGHTPMLDDPAGYAREVCALAVRLVREDPPRQPLSAC